MPRAYGITNAAPYASAPAVGAAGDSYFNTTDKSLYVSDGTVWVKTGPGTGGAPSGAAGGKLSGTYPNPGLAARGVGAAELDAIAFARVTKAAPPQVASVTFTALSFDTITSAGTYTGDLFTLASPDRFTITTAGVYAIGGNLEFSGGGGDRRILAIYVGAAEYARAEGDAPTTPNTNRAVCVSCVAPLAASTVVQVKAYQDSGAAMGVLSAVGWIARLGAIT